MEPPQVVTEIVQLTVLIILQVAGVQGVLLHVQADVSKTVTTTVLRHVNRIVMDSVMIRVVVLVSM